MKKGPLYSIFASKCPKCNLGDLYVDNNPFHLRKLGDMHKNCSCCGQVYEPETGFYYGAMYVSYGVSILLMFIPAAILYFGFNAQFPTLLATVLGIYVLSFPLVFRWSRNIWLNIFVRFDPELKQKLSSHAV
ncbi:MAG: DUF983 domain-containing protein [Bacteroidia bacterium]|jgi:hypothetical protein|nr:DUF983 domain-containing protein [Bacteroidia bacterium]